MPNPSTQVLFECDLTERLNDVLGTMQGQPSYPGPAIEVLSEVKLSVDTGATSTPEANPSPPSGLPPLVSKTKRGKRYVRPKAVQRELHEVIPRPPCEWIGRAADFRNESLAFLTRLTHQNGEEYCGRLMQELNKRIQHRAGKFCTEMDDYDTEQFVSAVEIRILKLLLAKRRNRYTEFLEVAFGKAVQNVCMNQLKKFQKSTAGNIIELPNTGDVDDFDGEEIERPIEEFLPDPSSGPDEILLRLDLSNRRGQLAKKALDAVMDRRHRNAAFMFFGEGIPVVSSRRGQKCLTRYFRQNERTIRYWTSTAMKQMRAALGVNIRGAADSAASLSTFMDAAGTTTKKGE